jgi:hypothetical protein
VAAQTWGNCAKSTSKYKTIRTFSRVKASADGKSVAGGTSFLDCGTLNWGYRHITRPKADGGHLEQWQALGAEAGENWHDTADLAIQSAFADPDKTTYRADNDTFCYSHLIYLADKNTRKIVGENSPMTVIARVSTNIITSYPSSGCK